MRVRDAINRLLSRGNCHIIKRHPSINRLPGSILRPDCEYVLARELLRSPEFFFVQIGANDGVRSDRLHALFTRHRLKGLVVEPLPDLFAKLRETYKDHPQIIPVNCAIHASAKEAEIFRIPTGAEVPDYCHGIASFSRRHLEAFEEKVPGIGRLIVSQKVPCMSLARLLESHGSPPVNLLQIDTEGYDFEIIKSLDFKGVKPRIIRYETSSISAQDAVACAALLAREGYKFLEEADDMVAYLG